MLSGSLDSRELLQYIKLLAIGRFFKYDKT